MQIYSWHHLGEWQNTFWAIQIFIELCLFDIFYYNWISRHTNLLICLRNPAFHYNGKFIMQIPDIKKLGINEEYFTRMFLLLADAFTK
jgi:hypothetical protein